MSDYKPSKRRRRSRGGRRHNNNKQPQENSSTHQRHKATKPQGLLGWLKKLFGLSPKEQTKSQRTEQNQNREHSRQRNGSPNNRREHRENRDSKQTAKTSSDSTTTNPATTKTTSNVRRKAELLEVTTPRLYVGNLSYDISESDLFDLFSQAAKVRNVEIARDRESEKSKGFGFVEFASVEDAKAAQAKLNEYELAGRPLLVSGAKALTPRRTPATSARDKSDPSADLDLAIAPAPQTSEEVDSKHSG